MITFMRLRPASSVTEVWASTRRREGTTALEVDGIDHDSVVGALAGGVLPVGRGAGEVEAAGWVADPAEILELQSAAIDSSA